MYIITIHYGRISEKLSGKLTVSFILIIHEYRAGSFDGIKYALQMARNIWGVEVR